MRQPPATHSGHPAARGLSRRYIPVTWSGFAFDSMLSAFDGAALIGGIMLILDVMIHDRWPGASTGKTR